MGGGALYAYEADEVLVEESTISDCRVSARRRLLQPAEEVTCAALKYALLGISDMCTAIDHYLAHDCGWSDLPPQCQPTIGGGNGRRLQPNGGTFGVGVAGSGGNQPPNDCGERAALAFRVCEPTAADLAADIGAYGGAVWLYKTVSTFTRSNVSRCVTNTSYGGEPAAGGVCSQWGIKSRE